MLKGFLCLLYKSDSSKLFQLRSALFWYITQRILGIPFRGFGTTYRSRLQGSRNGALTSVYAA